MLQLICIIIAINQKKPVVMRFFLKTKLQLFLIKLQLFLFEKHLFGEYICLKTGCALNWEYSLSVYKKFLHIRYYFKNSME